MLSELINTPCVGHPPLLLPNSNAYSDGTSDYFQRSIHDNVPIRKGACVVGISLGHDNSQFRLLFHLYASPIIQILQSNRLHPKPINYYLSQINKQRLTPWTQRMNVPVGEGGRSRNSNSSSSGKPRGYASTRQAFFLASYNLRK